MLCQLPDSFRMPSRKRAKGRARKAKALQRSSNLILHDESVCRHGCDIISKDDLRYKFVEQFEVEFNATYDSPDVDNDIVVDCFLDTMKRLDKIEEFRLIRKDDTTQKDLLPLFVCLGTNLLLKYRQSKPYDLAMVVAVAAIYSQHNWNEYKVLTPESNRKIMRNLTDGLDYDVCRFFYKRSPCRCLKKKYSNTRSKPRYIIACCPLLSYLFH